MKTSLMPIALLALLFAGCDKDDDTDTDMGTDTDTDTDTTMVEALYRVAPNDPGGITLPNEADFDYYVGAQFIMEGVLGGPDGVTYGDDANIICTSGCEDNVQMEGDTPLYPVDNAFGFDVQHFADSVPRERDGVHAEGWVGTILDGDGDSMGLLVSTVATSQFLVPTNMGGWCAGLASDPVKCETEHYVTLEHVKTCYETIPYWFSDVETGETHTEYGDCIPMSDELDMDVNDLIPDENSLDEIAVGTDYAVSKKDDGKFLFRFGNVVKRPTDMRVNLAMPVPEEWLIGDDVYVVNRAELAIVHTITNSPNDQIRPEDYENEGATGRKPSYEVDSDGRWVSTVDCYQGDGTFLPVGTVYRNPDFADPTAITADVRDGYTNAWFRTLDRNPFAFDEATGRTPRWRLKAPKMGQDLPGFEIPIDNCTPPPLLNDERLYERGDLTTTVIDLLDFGFTEVSPFATSTGWMEPTDQPMTTSELSANGVYLSDNFDLAVYIKGERQAVELYSAHLYIDYELAQ
jgi:hypothetical protein